MALTLNERGDLLSDYRLLYYLQTPTEIILVTIYSKSEQSDISAEEIRRILKEAG